ncbi:MAG: DUF3276 family protein [Candidatus Paceibacterota bacterium]|jgi:hypothetical protein
MQQIIYLIIGLLIGYLFFKIHKLSENKIVENKQENQIVNQSSKELGKINHPSFDSRKMKAGGRDYFFDLRATQKGDKYLHITESRIKDDSEIRGSIVIFPEYLDEFFQTLGEMKGKIKK